ncbi:hypothetical protein PHYBOEH_008750 [Phytophthora boehmeriae]|uniref:Uncharacterized protein n=1 Tax=Phytophthora boehmeriae TaxID=109152 RepID=A0A8T1VZ82_9STRA|nr:hypothetical protein PHYBOEH_008750 [Phytophthora boehmeriae]
MAARLAELAAKERELKLQTKRGNGGNGDDDDNFDEELDNLRTTTIECNEECGLLLFNVLQEFSLMKEVDLVYFPDVVYSRMIEQVLAYFRKGMEICEGDDDANEIRFRLLYMIGKTLKKMRWCELRQQKASDPEALVTAKEMAECFAKAEASREEGDMEHALVHAFYALQGLRADLILSESPSVSALQLVCDHYFEEEDEEEEEEGDDGEDEDGVTGKKDDRDGAGTMNEAATLKSSSTNPTASEVTSFNNIAQDETNAANPSRKDEILALLSDNKSDNFTREVNVTVARGWLALNIIDALESIPNEDRYFHPSRYVLARVVYWLSNFHNVLINCGYKDDNIGALVEAVKARRSQLKVDGPSDAAARAVKEMAPLFDKRRPQIVAIWFSEYIPAAKKFEELNQRQMKYDYYRLKYWRFYVGMLEENMAYARLKEIGTWVMACKEEHDVISIMLGIVLQARGKVLRARLQGAMDKLGSANVVVASVSEPTNSVRPQLSGGDQPVDTVFKQLAKAYAYYLEVVDAQSRLIQVMENSGLLLEYAELPMVAVFFLGVTAYPSQVLLLEKDRALMDIHFLDNVTVIKNALRRGELPPRIYDAQGREAWRSYLDAARSFCEEKWPERSGKGKVVKNRSRVKPSGSSSSETNASQPAPDTSN